MLPTIVGQGRNSFHSRSPKAALNDIFFYLFTLLNNIKFISYTRKLLQKIIELKKLCKKYLKINHVKFRIHAIKVHLCFYKNSAIQTFTVISSKAVHFNKHFTYEV